MPRLLLALPLALAFIGPAAADDLKIDNVRVSYTPHGPDRPDQKNIEIVPGEELFFRYRITGMSTDASGAVNCSLRLRILQGDKTLLDDASPVRGVLALGGGEVHGNARINVGPNIMPGKYTARLTAIDALAKKEAEFTREITVKMVDAFTVINPRFSYDSLGAMPAPTVGMVDQKLFFRMQLVGFDRSMKKVKLRMEMQILDADGKPQTPKPVVVGAATDKPEEVAMAVVVTFNGDLSLNRAGEFKLRFKFFDELGGKDVTFEVPLKVSE